MHELQEKARLLKQKGYTYPMIEKELPGITINWCKRNLAEVTKVSKEDADKARALKMAGRSHRKIVQELDGSCITEHWCKVNLRDVQKNKAEADLVRSIVLAATKPKGVTNYAIRKLIRNSCKADKESDYEYISKLKSKARQQDKRCVFRPEWMSAHQAMASKASIIDKADTIFELLQELASEHSTRFCVDKGSALREIVNLANPWLHKEPITRRLERYEAMVAILSRQVTQIDECIDVLPYMHHKAKACDYEAYCI